MLSICFIGEKSIFCYKKLYGNLYKKCAKLMITYIATRKYYTIDYYVKVFGVKKAQTLFC